MLAGDRQAVAKVAGRMPVGLTTGALSFFACSPAWAQETVADALPAQLAAISSNDLITIAVAVVALIIFCWAMTVTRRLEHGLQLERRRRSEIEAQLNDAEAALTAEPHLLFIWRGRSDQVERVIGDMRETCTCPATPEQRADFAFWLEPESATTLTAALNDLQARGTPFNFGVKTQKGELLEADGRAAGGLATLRLRPLAGERRDITRLAHEARRLNRQVERLTAILDKAPLPIWLRDNDRHLIWANQAYVQATGSDSVTSVIRDRLELVAPDTIAPVEQPAGASGPERRRGQAFINGRNHYLDIVEIPVVEGEAGFAFDVTALEEVRGELSRHESAHASTLDKLTTAIAIFGADQRLRFSNAAFANLWNLEPSWLATRPSDGEILDRLRQMRMLPEQANYREWRAQALTIYTKAETREDWWHLPDGRTLRVVAEQHPFGGVTYLYENITEQIRLESRYNELISVQRETIDNLNESLALFGADGRLKLYNPAYAQLWDLGADFLATEPHIDSVFAACRERLPDDAMWDEIKYAVTSVDDDRHPLQGRIDRPDGKIFYFALVPLPDGNTLLTYTDVTDSARIERALRERAEALETADRLKTDFLSNVSYELRTPLCNIIGFAESLAMGLAGDLSLKQREYVGDILSSSADLLSIIDAILDLTTIDAGAMELRFERVDISEVLTEAARQMQPRIEKRRITLLVEIPQEPETMVVDRRRIVQVLHNLLSNAIGFSEDLSTVRLGAQVEGDYVNLWVADQGKGMDQEFQKVAFDRFRARPGISGHRGPGLGLSLVKSFVELHEGAVTLRSRLGHGTTVVCRLPRNGPSTASVAPELPAQLPQAKAL
jgi:signal transduction histidine kinase